MRKIMAVDEAAQGECQDPIPVSTALFGDTSDTTSTGLAQRLGTYPPGLLEWRVGTLLFDDVVPPLRHVSGPACSHVTPWLPS
ncbi:hypothetical protein CB1_001424001 [Camelus ferus]|nr:hypothetical protein CB1_001424001 [Camelus ferus]